MRCAVPEGDLVRQPEREQCVENPPSRSSRPKDQHVQPLRTSPEHAPPRPQEPLRVRVVAVNQPVAAPEGVASSCGGHGSSGDVQRQRRLLLEGYGDVSSPTGEGGRPHDGAALRRAGGAGPVDGVAPGATEGGVVDLRREAVGDGVPQQDVGRAVPGPREPLGEEPGQEAADPGLQLAERSVVQLLRPAERVFDLHFAPPLVAQEPNPVAAAHLHRDGCVAPAHADDHVGFGDPFGRQRRAPVGVQAHARRRRRSPGPWAGRRPGQGGDTGGAHDELVVGTPQIVSGCEPAGDGLRHRRTAGVPRADECDRHRSASRATARIASADTGPRRSTIGSTPAPEVKRTSVEVLPPGNGPASSANTSRPMAQAAC